MVEVGLFIAFALTGVALGRPMYSKMEDDWDLKVRRGVVGLLVAVGAMALDAAVCLYYLFARPPAKDTLFGSDYETVSAVFILAAAGLAAYSLTMIFQGVRTTVRESRNTAKQLDAFIQNTPAAVSLKDTDRRYTMVNNVFKEWFSTDQSNLVARRGEDIADAEHMAVVTEIENAVLADGNPVVREVEVPTVNNSLRTVLLHKFPIKDAEGKIIGIGGIETDISRQKEAEDKLEETLARLNEAMRITKLGFWEWDEINDCSIKLAPNFLEMMDIPVQEDENLVFTADDMYQYLHPEDVEAYKHAANVRLSLHDRFVANYRIKRPNGQVRHLQEIGQAVRSGKGELIRSFGTIQDITEPVELAASLRRAREEAVAADRAKTEFLAHMSHELRSPLNSILGFSQIIEGGIGNVQDMSRHSEYAGYIRQSGQHLLEIIDDILDLAKIEHGTFDIHLSSVEIATSINDCIKIVESSRPAGTASFTVKVDEDASHFIADQRMIRQILINIYSNAAKFTPETGRIDTRVSLMPTEDSIRVEISDTGCGIDSKDIQHVLAPFGQARSNINVAHGGVGLGLPLTKRMVELHHGTLNLSSRPGEGTTVTLIFPIRQPTELPEVRSA